MPNDMETQFAPPERSSAKELKNQRLLVQDPALLAQGLYQLPQMVLILNQNRQIIYANQQTLAFLNSSLDEVVGKRPGEALQCIQSCLNPSGCGTSQFCRECGAVKSILVAQSGKISEEECRVIVRRGDAEQAMNLRVWSIPLKQGKHEFTLFTLKDIADEKRLEMLGKSFFHSLLGHMTSISLYLEGMKRGAIPSNPETLGEMINLVRYISNTIQDQQRMVYLEEGEEISQHPTEFPITDMLWHLTESYRKNGFPQHTKVELELPDPEQKITTDKVLLECALGNLIKNAFEASKNDDTITIGYRREKTGHLFYVMNPCFIPEQAQGQIFQRTFSTKGKGRGFGTHNTKVIVETLLHGQIFFDSTEKNGTTFYISLK